MEVNDDDISYTVKELIELFRVIYFELFRNVFILFIFIDALLLFICDSVLTSRIMLKL